MNYFEGQRKSATAKLKIILFAASVFAALFACLLCACNTRDNAADGNNYGTHTVTFESAGGSFVEAALSDCATGRISKPQTPERERYEFIGWYTSADYKTAFDFNEAVDSDITLYAKWRALFTTVTFYGNGCTGGAMPTVEVGFGEVITLPENRFVRTGYTFAGWSSKSAGSVQNRDKGFYFVPENGGEVTVLYACWKPNGYNVYFDTQGADVQCEAVPVYYDQYPAGFEKPHKPGFKFVGFFTEKNGRGACYYDASMCSVRAYDVADDLTLYACWTPDIKTITFKANCEAFAGEVGALSSQTLQTLVLPENAFTRTGYTFKEWNAERDGSGKAYACGDGFFVSEKDGDFEFYAIWEAVSYSVVFLDGGDSKTEAHFYDEPKKLCENAFIKTGHSFAGWSETENGTVDFYDGETVCNLSSQAGAEILLYAVWQANAYNITLDTQGGIGGSDYVSVVYGLGFPETQPPKKFGYVFGGYFSGLDGTGKMYLDKAMTAAEASDLAEDCSVYAYWQPKPVELRFAENGGSSGTVSPVSSGSLLEVRLPACTFRKVGYDFADWNEKPDGSGPAYAENTVFVMPVTESDVYLYPVWIPKSINISFDGNGCTDGATCAVTGYSDTDMDLPECGFERRGYDFAGWGVSASSEDAVADIYTVPASDEALVLYALWNIHVYVINYLMNGGENSSRNPVSYTVLDSTIYLNTPKYAGYDFKGWKSENGSAAASVPAGSVGDKTFTAEWKIIVYKIYYILDGGENNAANPETYTVEDYFILADPEREGNTFEGWSEGNTVFKGSTGNKTFTAEWNETRYKITYELHGGINGSGNPGSFVFDSGDITLNDPTRGGYNFNGWVNESGNAVSGFIGHNSMEDRYFEARWTIVTYGITYVLNGGTNSPANPSSYTVEDTVELEDPEFPGFIFDGWTEGNIIEEGNTGNRTFTANWRKTQYSILYVIGEGAENPPENPSEYFVDSEDITILAPSRRHYSFIGWRAQSEEGEIYPTYVIRSGSAENLILFAVWEAVAYAVNYELDGGANNADNPDSVTYADIVVLSAPTKTGYEFTGWTVGGELVTELIGIGSDITLTATWEIIEYVITYDLGGLAAINDNPDKYTVEDALTLNEPVCEGYTFLYWTNGEGVAVNEITVGSTGDICLTAHWELIEISPPTPEE